MVGITETVLRDGHQSLIATRMRVRHMLPAAERLDAVGYRSLEVWGGATFDVGLRYLKEDPWERLRLLKRAMPKTPLQMLLRGQNLVGYRHYSDDLVEAFVAEAAARGIGVFRIFDALNDPRNMAVAIAAARRAGAVAQGTICYTRSPVHTLPAFVELGRTLAGLGANELCIKDMGGFLGPIDARALTAALVKEIGLPVVVHTHSSSGMSTLACLAASEAGATAIDAALSPFSGGASQPPTEAIVGALQGGPLDTGLDLPLLADLATYFRDVLEHYRPMLDPRSLMTDPQVLLHQVPGGMLSNLISQLKEQEQIGRLSEVLEEIPRVRSDLGYPPLVTPTSQIVGAQAVLNVLTGGRYRQVSREVQDYVRGLYGRPPGPIDGKLARQVLGSERPIEGRPADLLQPELAKAVEGVRALVPASDVAEALSYALFPMVYRSFVASRSSGIGWAEVASAALGTIAVLRQPEIARTDGGRSAASGALEAPPRRSVSPWASAGRARQAESGRWVHEGRARPRR